MRWPGGNLRIAVLAVAACMVLLVLLGLFSTDRASDTALGRPSTFFTDSTGARAIYLVLGELFPEGQVAQWRRPLTLLDDGGGPSTLIVLGPRIGLGPEEARRLDAWIEAGGQLVLAASEPWAIDGGNPENPQDYAGRHGLEPTRESGEGAAFESPAMISIGRGRLYYVPDTHAFSNGRLGESGSALWLADRIGEWGGAVLFDEHHLGFGQRRGLGAIVGAFLVTPWGLATMQLALAGLVYIVGYRKRFGRPVDPLPPERTSRIETVAALGDLFRAADARRLAVKAIDQHLTTGLSSGLGHRVDLEDARVGKRLEESAIGEPSAYAAAVREVLAGRRPEDAELVRIGHLASVIGRSLRHGSTEGERRASAG